MFTGAWRRSQKPMWRVEARTMLYDHQILRPTRSVDDKAILATRVAEIQAGSRESVVACMRVPGAVVRA